MRRRGWPCWKRRVRCAIWVARGGSGCELPTIELVLPFRSVGGVRQIRLRFGIGPVSEKIGYARPAPSDAWHAKIGNVHFGGHVHYPIFVPQTVHFWGLLFRYRAGLSQRSSGTGPANGTKPDRFRTSISSCWRSNCRGNRVCQPTPHRQHGVGDPFVDVEDVFVDVEDG